VVETEGSPASPAGTYPDSAGQGCCIHQEFEQAALWQPDFSDYIEKDGYMKGTRSIQEICAVSIFPKLYFFIKSSAFPYKIIRYLRELHPVLLFPF